MFAKSARYYDKIYAKKNYAHETEILTNYIHQHLQTNGRRLLDIACGTGKHLTFLKNSFEVTGIDLEEGLLELARQKNPDIPFFQANMLDFQLDVSFDVITCLFSSIGYVRTIENLHTTIKNMAQHLNPGGLLIIEPWITPDNWHTGTVHALLIDEPELKIARLNTSFKDGNLSHFDLHYLIATPSGTEHFVERHELGLFTRDEIEVAFHKAKLEVVYLEDGLTGRGLYLGKK